MVDIIHVTNRLTTMADPDIHGFEFNEGVSNKEINNAEFKFRGKFPEDYRHFLSNFGCGYVSSEEFIGLGGDLHLNIIHVREEQRRMFPRHFGENLIPIRSDGFGNYDCIDLSLSNPKMSQIVFWSRESNELDLIGWGYWLWFDQMLDIIEDAEK